MNKFFVFLTVFLTGWTFTLPVTDKVLPFWLTPIQPIHGVYLYEVLVVSFLLVYFLFSFHLFVRLFVNSGSWIALLIAGIGVIGIVSALVNSRPAIELLGNVRYFVLAIFFLLCIDWSNRYSPSFILRIFLLGILSSGLFNIHYSFLFRVREVGGLPVLLGQHGPGVPLGLSILLGGWLWFEKKNIWDVIISFAALIVGIIGATISYSKLALILEGCGIIVWCGILVSTMLNRHNQKIFAIVLVGCLMVMFVKRQAVVKFVNGLGTFVYYKFNDFFIRNSYATDTRFQYFYITAEILSKNPIFGVSYGGFYDAAVQTSSYDSDFSNPEDEVSGEARRSNPHNSFLFYASANGFPGLFLVIALVLMGINTIRRALFSFGMVGKLLGIFFFLGYLLIGNTIPTLFNSPLLYFPWTIALVSINSRGDKMIDATNLKSGKS